MPPTSTPGAPSQSRHARETITGDWAKFDPQANKLVVGGSVKLVQGSTVLTGKELRADLDTNKVEMTGGRVKGQFPAEVTFLI